LIVDAIVPALDEEASIGGVVAAIPRPLVRTVVVVDNGSRDRTAEVARAAGAAVVREPARGYGAACLAGMAHLGRLEPPPDAVAFLDGDGADDPGELAALLGPIARGEADLVVGSRTLGAREPGALSPQQRVGNALATALIAALHRHRYSDLGPFRAIRFPSLRALGMRERAYGWTVEMQLAALAAGLRVVEVPVRYRRRRAGRSKVSRTVRGTVGAGATIVSTIVRHAVRRCVGG
jgi:glycosyltransferase involved in cell wall biosynthesis